MKKSDADEEEDDGPALKDDPEYAKYWKMLKMGLPKDAARNALQRDGKDPAIIDLDPEKSLKSQMKSDNEDNSDDGPALKDDPEYAKYWKMLKMGLPKDAARNALQRDGKDPAIIDFDPEKSLASQLNGGKKKGKTKKDKKKGKKGPAKPKVRRKKIYWTKIEVKDIAEDSLWHFVQDVAIGKLKYNPKEFEDLFIEEISKKKVEPKKAGGGEKKEKKAFQVIEGKRCMNGGIILARLKVPIDEVAKQVDMMDAPGFDDTWIKGLLELLPTEEESTGLKGYIQQHKSGSEEERKEAMEDLCAAEKYMVRMMEVESAKEKFECLLFKLLFDNRLDDSIKEINLATQACDDLRQSDRFRNLLGMILSLGNLINTGGEGKLTAGFTLDTLLKLNEAKAFDKKTSVLFYLVKLVKQNDASLLELKGELASVVKAENVDIKLLSGDLQKLKDDVDVVKKAAKEDGDKKRKTHENCQRTPMEIYIDDAEKKVEKGKAKQEELKEKYLNLLKYFGEDAELKSGQFFSTINTFVKEFGVEQDKHQRQEEAKAKDEKRAAAQKAKEEKINASKKAKSDAAAKSAMKDSKNATDPLSSDLEANNVTKLGKKPKETPPIDGIGALAAKSAASKLGKKSTEQQPFKGGAGALKSSAIASKFGRRKSNVQLPAGGVGALAASAGASTFGKKSTENTPLGGIGALAASSSSSKFGRRKSNVNEQTSAGGIGALASSAAASKFGKKSTEQAPAGGIGALAASAAASKFGKKSTEQAPAGGIGAMAASAAASKFGKKSTEQPSSNMRKNQSELTKQMADATSGRNFGKKETPIRIGGVAAMALAAQKAREKNNGSGSGIGAMAASALAARNGLGSLKRQSARVGNEEVAPSSGGIAAMSKAAAKLMENGSEGGVASLVAAAVADNKPTSKLSDRLNAYKSTTQQNKDRQPSMEKSVIRKGGVAAMIKKSSSFDKSPLLSKDNDSNSISKGNVALRIRASKVEQKPSMLSKDNDSDMISKGSVAALLAASKAKDSNEYTIDVDGNRVYKDPNSVVAKEYEASLKEKVYITKRETRSFLTETDRNEVRVQRSSSANVTPIKENSSVSLSGQLSMVGGDLDADLAQFAEAKRAFLKNPSRKVSVNIAEAAAGRARSKIGVGSEGGDSVEAAAAAAEEFLGKSKDGGGKVAVK